MDEPINTEIKYVNVEPSAALDEFVQEHIKSLHHRIYLHQTKYAVGITIKADAKNAEGKIISFEVDGTFRIARRADLRAVEKMSDVHQAVTAVIKSLEKQIHRLTEKQERSRKTIGKSLKSVREFKAEVFAEVEDLAETKARSS